MDLLIISSSENTRSMFLELGNWKMFLTDSHASSNKQMLRMECLTLCTPQKNTYPPFMHLCCFQVFVSSPPFPSFSQCFPHLLTCSFPSQQLPSSFLIYSAFISLKTKNLQTNKKETKGHSGLNCIKYYSMVFNFT